MNKTNLWHVIVSRSILQSKYGMRVIKGRLDKGKYISPFQLPDMVKLCFDITEEKAGYFIESFKDENAILLYESQGAKVKRINLTQYRIDFPVTMKVTHPKQKEYIKTVRRDRYGHFLSKEGHHK